MKLTKRLLALLIAAFVLCASLTLLGCGDPASSNSNSTTNNNPTNIGSTNNDPSNGNPTTGGTVTVYMPSPSGLADALAAGFEAKTGIKVEQYQGTTGEILARLEAEKANPQADVVILASWSDGLSLKAEGQLLSYQSSYADKMHSGMVDSDYMLYGSSASAVGVIYNTDQYPNGLSADWKDFTDSQYANDLSIPDPTLSGACKDFVAGFVTAFSDGQATLAALAANGMVNGGGNKPALAAVESGEIGILVGGVDYNAYSDIAKGEHIGFYYPASGTVINPRPAMIMNTAPHVENAKLFIDYLLSDEAQQLVAEAYLIPGRADITTSYRTNVADIPTFTTDWTAMMNTADETAAYVVEVCSKNN